MKICCGGRCRVDGNAYWQIKTPGEMTDDLCHICSLFNRGFCDTTREGDRGDLPSLCRCFYHRCNLFYSLHFTMEERYGAEFTVKDTSLADGDISLSRAVTEWQFKLTTGYNLSFFLDGNPVSPGDHLEGRVFFYRESDAV